LERQEELQSTSWQWACTSRIFAVNFQRSEDGRSQSVGLKTYPNAVLIPGTISSSWILEHSWELMITLQGVRPFCAEMELYSCTMMFLLHAVLWSTLQRVMNDTISGTIRTWRTSCTTRQPRRLMIVRKNDRGIVPQCRRHQLFLSRSFLRNSHQWDCEGCDPRHLLAHPHPPQGVLQLPRPREIMSLLNNLLPRCLLNQAVINLLHVLWRSIQVLNLQLCR